MTKKDNKKARSSTSKSSSSTTTSAAAGQKRKREVQVVVCPSAFPDFATVGGPTSRKRQEQRNGNGRTTSDSVSKYDPSAPATQQRPVLDVQETIREVHKFGATGFTGAQAKNHQASEYERITGRTQKRHKIPTKILVGMRKKAMDREEKQLKEIRESGVVSHHSAQGKKKKKRREEEPATRRGAVNGVFGSNKSRNKGDRRKMTSNSFGPAPDVGFLVKGMLKVKQPR